MEHFHYRNKCQIGHFFMNFHYARYENLKKSVPPKFKNEASDHLKQAPEVPMSHRKSRSKEQTGTDRNRQDYICDIENYCIIKKFIYQVGNLEVRSRQDQTGIYI